VLDPVLGDDGELYVSKEVIPMYKSIIPLADIILPNQYEAEWLSEVRLDSIDAIVPCFRRLHKTFLVRNVVISSLRLESHPGIIICCGSTCTSANEPRVFAIKTPIIDGPFVGTGDLFSALVVARLDPFVKDLVPSDTVPATQLVLARLLEGVIASMQGVLRSTKHAMDMELQRAHRTKPRTAQEEHVNIMRAAELRLVTSQDTLLHPHIDIHAHEISSHIDAQAHEI
jgi:pyridoxine kinase